MAGYFFLAGLASLLLTGLLRRYAIRKSLFDIPNDRSSHSVPTPRGGGLAIVLVVLMGALFFWWWDIVALAELLPLFGAGSLVALVGWMDDHGHLAARWRLLTHFIASGWVLYWLSGMPLLPVHNGMLGLELLGYMLAALYLVWLLNLYNFMDGINGIASVEAITVCLGGVVLYLLVSADGAGWLLPMLLLAAVLGFLFWNFPNAKIFMGDVGSGFIGILLGIFSLQALGVNPELFWGWLVLLGVFIIDATLTLARRVLRGEKFYEAHCSHAYQHAARRWGHSIVTISVGLINILWLLPMAYFVVKYPEWSILLAVLALLPLVVLVFLLGTVAQD